MLRFVECAFIAFVIYGVLWPCQQAADAVMCSMLLVVKLLKSSMVSAVLNAVVA